MSVWMILAKRGGIMRREQPPKKITRRFLRSVAREPELTTLNLATSATHLGYGSVGGVVYAVIGQRWFDHVPPVSRGILYGLLVWTISYVGWVPALRLMPHPANDQPGRVATMILAHVIYGGALGLLESGFRKR